MVLMGLFDKDSVWGSIDLDKDPLDVVRTKLQVYLGEIAVEKIRAYNDGKTDMLADLKTLEGKVRQVMANIANGEYGSSNNLYSRYAHLPKGL